jgi:SagB-type dehydrogenase family enzyme
MTASAYERVVAYHQATKHHFNRYARSAGFMDWANQPDPFRTFEGAERLPLPLVPDTPALPYDDLHTPVAGPPMPLNDENLSSFLALSMGLSAWKKAGASRWALRINPSSGNLHPTETHLVLPAHGGSTGGVYHYASFDHALERRADLPEGCWPPMVSHFGGPGFLVALSSIHWRESWKYGERAFRYCLLDAGHALAALSYAARLHNWRLVCLSGASDRQIKTLLGFDRTGWHALEEEVPELICWVSTETGGGAAAQYLTDQLVEPFQGLALHGTPNPLSAKPVDWSAIADVSDAVKKSQTTAEPGHLEPMPQSAIPTGRSAAEVIRQRRSAVNYHPQDSISTQTFLSILSPTLARRGAPPFAALSMPAGVHLLLFVHRVEGTPPGLYLLARRSDHLAGMQARWRKDFLWQPVQAGLPLYRLLEGDVTGDAMELSCHQEIAGQSAFAVAMVAAFEENLRLAPHKYRHLHWECGMIGQVLYLGAEAHGIRGTGIGCFFDDPVHRLLGIEDHRYQTLYHFTVGHPIEDKRLETLAAYHHLDPRAIACKKV